MIPIKRSYLFAIALIVLAVFGFGLFRSLDKQTQSPNPGSKSLQPDGEVVAEIIMTKDGYKPNELKIKAGQAIRFVNKSGTAMWPASNIHPTHELYPDFDPKKEIKPDESWTFTFHDKGNWRMHDHLYPYIKGKITVD